MSLLTDAKDQVRVLSKKALEVTEDVTLNTLEKKNALDKLEPEIKTWCDEVQNLEHIEEQRKGFLAATGQAVTEAAGDAEQTVVRSIGQQFVAAKNYQDAVEGGLKGNWSTGEIELKTTLTEGTAGAPGGGYQAANSAPTLAPGIVDIRFRELTIADLFPAGTTNSPLIRYLVETAVTNAAAAVLEGGLKPESAIAFSKVDEVLHKLATFLPVSDEMLEDWAQAQSYIDARLILFVKIAEEAQLLTGDGAGANMVGVLNRPGLATPIVRGTASSPGSDNDMDAIYRQITAIRVSSFLEPDSIVADPTAWQTIILSKATGSGTYYAGGPFVGTAPATLWGKRVVVTPGMTAGSALVGAFAQGGQIFRKGGLTVEASNSHADFFQRNLTAIRAEERIGLAIYRPGAFGLVSNL